MTQKPSLKSVERLAILGAALVASTTPHLSAQQPSSSAASLVREFRDGYGTGIGPALAILDVLFYPERHPSGLAVAVADELEAFVRRGEGTSEMRYLAVTAVAYARSPDRSGSLEGTVDRVSAMFWGSEDRGVRTQALYVTLNVPDQPGAARFLSNVARSDSDMAYLAVGMLEGLGDAGLDALRTLSEGPAPHDPEVRAYLARRAAEGFAPAMKREPGG